MSGETEDDKASRVRPDILQAALLHKISKSLGDLNAKIDGLASLVKEQIPLGMVDPHNLTVTTTPFAYRPNHPLFAVSIVNDGPNDCWIVVNTGKSSTTPYHLLVDEVYEEDLGSAKIQDIYMHTDTGTAALRIRGTR